MQNSSIFSRARRAYEENIRRLARYLPKYNQLLIDLGGSANISLLDYSETGNVHEQNQYISYADSSPANVHCRLKTRDPAVSTRYIIVEDLTSSICLTLGAAFDLDPQFFVDHINSQVTGTNVPKTHVTHVTRGWSLLSSTKPYHSFYWYRPVGRHEDADVADRTTINKRRAWTKYEYRRPGSDETGESRWIVRLLHPGTNILRTEWDLPLGIAGASAKEAKAAALEERASIYTVGKGTDGCKFFVILLDKIPQKVLSEWPVDKSPTAPISLSKDASAEASGLYTALVPRIPLDAELSMLSGPVLESMYRSLPSTASSLGQFSSHYPNTPPRILFEIVLSDTLALLRIVLAMQSDISAATVSPDAELDVHDALETLLYYPWNEDTDPSPPDTATITLLRRTFTRTIESLDRALTSISDTLQFIESHRAIAEAESISRLSELAFLFIPLSFAASVFSMQVQELADPVPLSHFIALTLSLSATTYTIRALSRSAWMHRKKLAVLTALREANGIPAARPISNRSVLMWILQLRSGLSWWF
ncbi:hypothetical protein BJY04DRAFT_220066 [Aspergillus karnatakaensis]|uniref:uncharacterized protein n=1 Tax=Aspergillus karnatakaensis TaxID=1810916 RepID=UPI003CCD5B5E